MRRVSDEGAYADRAFSAEADRAGLEGRDRAFAQRLAYGAVQSRATLDYLLTALSSRPAAAIDPPLRDALHAGLYQLLFMDGVPDHAAVEQTVELAKDERGGGHRFANAVMRRAAREAADLLALLTDDTPAETAIRHSHPEWIVRMWWDLLGREETLALVERDNVPAENAVRANELRVTAGELAEALGETGVRTRPAGGLPEGLVLEDSLDVRNSAQFRAGLLMPQSRGSMLVSRLLAPGPGDTVLDLCAAPGAKTTHIAALVRGEGKIVAVERNAQRAQQLRRNCERMGASVVDVIQADAAVDPPPGEFDRVLVDAPCSSLGTLQSRPDARWRRGPETIAELAFAQAALLRSGAAHVRPGGTLVYSTCTICPQENEQVVDAFIAEQGDFAADDLSAEQPELAHPHEPRYLQILPHRHRTDGFFIARLARAGA
jgi:16S rRNA (cytosine967-C5)-methyltransferase